MLDFQVRNCKFLLLSLFFCTVQSSNLEEASIENKHNYDLKYYEYALNNRQPVGVIIPCYNRFDYLSKLLRSLEKNKESQSIPFFFALDGGPRSKQKEIVELIQNSKIRNKEIILRTRNYGLPKNLIDARRFMFEWCKFDKIIFMEDDLIVSPTYIKTLLNLWDWSQLNYDNIGAVQSCRYCSLSKQEKKTSLNLVKASDREWYVFDSYCMSRKVWDEMSTYLYEFEKFIDLIPQTDEFARQRSRPVFWEHKQQIVDWALSLVKQKNNKLEKNGKKRIFKSKDLESIFLRIAPCQDVMMAFSLWMAGYVKVQTVVNRIHHIGEIGTGCNEKLYKRLNKKTRLDNFDCDSFLKSFKV